MTPNDWRGMLIAVFLYVTIRGVIMVAYPRPMAKVIPIKRKKKSDVS